MLILERRPEQRVTLLEARTGRIIGQILVSEISDGAVKLGFDCPNSVSIVRSELAIRQGGQHHEPSQK